MTFVRVPRYENFFYYIILFWMEWRSEIYFFKNKFPQQKKEVNETWNCCYFSKFVLHLCVSGHYKSESLKISGISIKRQNETGFIWPSLPILQKAINLNLIYAIEINPNRKKNNRIGIFMNKFLSFFFH